MNTILNTEIGLLAIWDSKSLSLIDCRKAYQQNIVEEKGLTNLMNKGAGVFWNTGGDGTFQITLRINPKEELTEEEQEIIELKTLNKKLVVTSPKAFLGSPEWAGTIESEGLAKNQIEPINNLSPGTYSANVYFLYDESKPDKTGFVLTLRSVSKNHQFPLATQVPQLG